MVSQNYTHRTKPTEYILLRDGGGNVRNDGQGYGVAM